MTTNFIGLQQVTMVTVREGNGSEMEPHRFVQYFYDGDALIGKIDPKHDISH